MLPPASKPRTKRNPADFGTNCLSRYGRPQPEWMGRIPAYTMDDGQR